MCGIFDSKQFGSLVNWFSNLRNTMDKCRQISYYLNQSWLVISEILWYSIDGNFVLNARHIMWQDVLKNAHVKLQHITQRRWHTVTGGFPSQKASNAESVSTPWRHLYVLHMPWPRFCSKANDFKYTRWRLLDLSYSVYLKSIMTAIIEAQTPTQSVGFPFPSKYVHAWRVNP